MIRKIRPPFLGFVGIPLLFCAAIPLTVATTGPNGEPEVTLRSDGNAVYALDPVSGTPVWSETGLLYRERYSAAFLASAAAETPEPPQKPAPPVFVEVPMLRQGGCLYVVLDKLPGQPKRGNVLVALDLRAQGKLLWRTDAAVLTERRGDRVLRILDLGHGGLLRVEADDGRTFEIDVATGQGRAIDEIIL